MADKIRLSASVSECMKKSLRETKGTQCPIKRHGSWKPRSVHVTITMTPGKKMHIHRLVFKTLGCIAETGAH